MEWRKVSSNYKGALEPEARGARWQTAGMTMIVWLLAAGVVSGPAVAQTSSAQTTCARCQALERNLTTLDTAFNNQRRERNTIYNQIAEADRTIRRINTQAERNALAVSRATRDRSQANGDDQRVALEQRLRELRQETLRLEAERREAEKRIEERKARVLFVEQAVRRYRNAIDARRSQLGTCRSFCLPPQSEQAIADPRFNPLTLPRLNLANCPSCGTYVLRVNDRSSAAQAARRTFVPLKAEFDSAAQRVNQLDTRRDQILVRATAALRELSRFSDRDRSQEARARLQQAESDQSTLYEGSLTPALRARAAAYTRANEAAQGLQTRIDELARAIDADADCRAQCRVADVTLDVARNRDRDAGITGADGGERTAAGTPTRNLPAPLAADLTDPARETITPRLDPAPGPSVIVERPRPELGRTGVDRTGDGDDARFDVVEDGGLDGGLDRRAEDFAANNFGPTGTRGADRTPRAGDRRRDGRDSVGPAMRTARSPARIDDGVVIVPDDPITIGTAIGPDGMSLKDMPLDTGPRARISLRGGVGQRRQEGASSGRAISAGGWQTEVVGEERTLDTWHVAVGLDDAGGIPLPLGQLSTRWSVEVSAGDGDDSETLTQGQGSRLAIAAPDGTIVNFGAGAGQTISTDVETDLLKVRAQADLVYGDHGCGIDPTLAPGRCSYGLRFAIGYEETEEIAVTTLKRRGQGQGQGARDQRLRLTSRVATVDLISGLWGRVETPVTAFADGSRLDLVVAAAAFVKVGFADGEAQLAIDGGGTFTGGDDEIFAGIGGEIDAQLRLALPDWSVALGGTLQAKSTATPDLEFGTGYDIDVDVARDARVYIEATVPF